jgi:hypothetical protein
MEGNELRKRILRLAGALAVVGGTLLPVSAAGADVSDCTYGSGDCTPGNTTATAPPNDPPDPKDPGDDSTPSNRGSLPLTGGDAIGLALLGAGAVGAGTVLARVSRRNRRG